MKQLLLIDDTVVNKISYYHLACFVIALPFDFFYSEIVLVSFAIHTLIHVNKSKVKNIFTKPVLILTAVFFIGLAATLYSPEKAEGISIATRQLAILVLPVLFALTHLNLQKYQHQLLIIFGFTCTLTIVYLYVIAAYSIFNFRLPASSLFTDLFINHNFAAPIKMHATYLAVYTSFSLLTFLYFILTRPQLPCRWLYIIAIVILSAGMLQLSSRAVLIAFLIIINGVFPFFIFRGKKAIAFFVIASVISITTFVVIFNLDAFRERYISDLRTDLTSHTALIENAEPRLARWRATLEIIKQSPVIGYGSGAEKELLKEKYFEKKMFVSYLNEFNAHCEYLSFLIKSGIIGLALFMCVLHFGFASAIQKRDVLFLGFMTLITVVCLSENFLYLNKGIFFYSFFFSVFLFGARLQKEEYINVLTAKTGNPN